MDQVDRLYGNINNGSKVIYKGGARRFTLVANQDNNPLTV